MERHDGTDQVSKYPFSAFLPEHLTSALFLIVPVDSRLLARAVHPSWRAWLNAPEQIRLWSTLDLSDVSGASHRNVSLLRTAAQMASGTLICLDISGAVSFAGNKTLWSVSGISPLTTVLKANASSLRILRLHGASNVLGSTTDTSKLQSCISRCPHLEEFHADVYLEQTYRERGPPMLLAEEIKLHSLLHREWPYASLRIHELYLYLEGDTSRREELAGTPPSRIDVPAFSSALAAHGSVDSLVLGGWALKLSSADAEILLGGLTLRKLDVSSISITVEILSSISGLVRRGLQDFRMSGGEDTAFFLGEHVPEFVLAVRGSRLQELHLPYCCLWDELVAGTSIVGACAGLRTLKKLDLSGNYGSPHQGSDQGAESLAELLVDEHCALETLDVSDNNFGADGVRCIFEAVAKNKTLISLSVDLIRNGYRSSSAADKAAAPGIAEQYVLPALLANKTLRTLTINYGHDSTLKGLLSETLAAVAARGA